MIRINNMLSKISLIVAALLVISISACEDVNPPKGNQTAEEGHLFDILLPFSSVLIAKGDTFYIPVLGRTIEGDTFAVDPKKVVWTPLRVTSVFDVDSTGLMIVRDYDPSPFPQGIIANYAVEGAARADTAWIYMSEVKYDIGSVQVEPLDSARGGTISFAMLFTAAPKYYIRALDKSGNYIPGLESGGVFEVGVKKVNSNNKYYALFPFPLGNGTSAVVNFSALGQQLLHVEAWIHGERYVDSAEFTGMYPAESSISLGYSSALRSVFYDGSSVMVQPCGAISIMNPAPDTIQINFSGPTAEKLCGGVLPDTGSLIIPPSETRTRVLSVKDSISWEIKNLATGITTPKRNNNMVQIKEVSR